MIYGFITDTVFLDPTVKLTNLAKLTIPCGYMNPEILEYYMEQLLVKDVRDNRLPITYSTTNFLTNFDPSIYHTIHYLPEDVIDNMETEPDENVGSIQYDLLNEVEGNIDGSVFPSGPTILSESSLNFIVDYTHISENDDYSLLDSLSDDDKGKIFNIFEYLIYGTISTDTLSNIEDYLVGDDTFQDFYTLNRESGYVPSSLTLSSVRSVVKLFHEFDDKHSFDRFIPNWVSFSYHLTSGDNISFKLWISRADFAINYPLYNIISVIPPLPIATLLNPTSLTNMWTALTQSSEVTVNVLKTKMIEDNYSGYTGYTTLYDFGNEQHDVTFSILYKGKKPPTTSIRLKIIAYLETFETSATWQALFPNLYNVNQFFLVPIYEAFIRDCELQNPMPYPSICSVSLINDRVRYILNNIVIDNFSTMEAMTVAYNKMFIGVVNGNSESNLSLSEIYPDYQDWSATDVNFENMGEDTQDFSVLLNQVLAKASGEDNTPIGSVSESVIDNMTWYSFSKEGCEFLVVDKTSYITKIS